MENFTPTDAIALQNGRNDGFSNEWFWIIILLFFFMGNGWNNGNNDIARESTMNTQFMERDIAGVNQNIYNSTSALQSDICSTKSAIYDTRYDLGAQLSQNKYDNAIQLAGIDKDILLGNQTLAASMASCCCDLKNAIHADGEATRALITQNRISELEYQLNQANTIVSNQVQTQNILNSLGRFYTNPSVNPYTCYNSCGCNA